MSTRSASHESSPSCGATTTPRTSPSAVRIRTRWRGRPAGASSRACATVSRPSLARIAHRHPDLVGVREEREDATAGRALHGRDRRAEHVRLISAPIASASRRTIACTGSSCPEAPWARAAARREAVGIGMASEATLANVGSPRNSAGTSYTRIDAPPSPTSMAARPADRRRDDARSSDAVREHERRAGSAPSSCSTASASSASSPSATCSAPSPKGSPPTRSSATG